jgi:hypothetical protein
MLVSWLPLLVQMLGDIQRCFASAIVAIWTGEFCAYGDMFREANILS